MAGLFGFQLVRTTKSTNDDPNRQTVQTLPKDDRNDGAQEINAGFYGYGVSFDNTPVEDETLLISKYRDLAVQPEIERAIDDIVNETFSYENDAYPVEISLDDIDDSVLPKATKEKIRTEFKYILDLLDFKNSAYEVFKKWYVDGRIYYQKVIDTSDISKGLVELINIDPRKIRKVRQELKDKPQVAPKFSVATADSTLDNLNNNKINKQFVEFFLYNPSGISKDAPKGVQIAPDTIVYVHSGLFDKTNRTVLSYLHKAIKPFNQLRMMEDALVIYRIARAPERRVFNLEVGRLPKGKAEQYVQEMMSKFRRKLNYDATTGEVKDDRRYMTMLEDFWFPKVEGKGTTVETLAGGQNLGQLTDVDYFKKKLYEALNVPTSRFEQSSTPFSSQESEITRDELKFMKFVSRLRKRFSLLFDEIMATHLILKGIVTQEEWDLFSNDINYDFIEDNFFTEQKTQQVWAQRFQSYEAAKDLITDGMVSRAWVRKTLLNISDEEWAEMQKEIEAEKKDQENKAKDTFKFQQDNGHDMQGNAVPPPEPPQQLPPPAPSPFGNQQQNQQNEDVNEQVIEHQNAILEMLTELSQND